MHRDGRVQLQEESTKKVRLYGSPCLSLCAFLCSSTPLLLSLRSPQLSCNITAHICSDQVVKEFASLERCRASEEPGRAGTPRRRSRSNSPDRKEAEPEPEHEEEGGIQGLRVGMRVEYDSRSRRAWVPGTITRLRRDGTLICCPPPPSFHTHQ